MHFYLTLESVTNVFAVWTELTQSDSISVFATCLVFNECVKYKLHELQTEMCIFRRAVVTRSLVSRTKSALATYRTCGHRASST